MFKRSLNNWQQRKIRKALPHQSRAFEDVNELVIEERKGKQFVLSGGETVTEFMSCSYLGIDMDERVIEASSKNLARFGVTFPASRTRAVVKSFVVLEDVLSEIFSNHYTVMFQSLHLVHLGLLPLLASGEMPSYPIKKQPYFILDKTVHASVQINRGLLKQFGELVSIAYEDVESIQKQFAWANEHQLTPIAIADSVGSMGGVAPICYLLELADRYNGYVYLDDAHGTSIHGVHGQGYVLKCLDGYFHPRLLLTSSMAKAYGAVGGIAVLPTLADQRMVKRFATTYIFGGPPPLSIVDAAIAAGGIHLSDEIYVLQQKLWDNVRYFDSLLAHDVVNKGVLSPIRGILIGEEFKAIECALQLRKLGILVTTAMYPVVAYEHSILRLAFSAAHSKKDIQALCLNLKRVCGVRLNTTKME